MTHLAIDFVAALLAAPATSDDGMERSGGLTLFLVAFAMVCVAVSLYQARLCQPLKVCATSPGLAGFRGLRKMSDTAGCSF